MTRRRRELPLRHPGDSQVMSNAIDWCEAVGLPVRRCSLTQIRVAPLNFWPDSGSINIGSSRALPVTGLVAFQTVVRTWSSLTDRQRQRAFETLRELGVDDLWKALQNPYLL